MRRREACATLGAAFLTGSAGLAAVARAGGGAGSGPGPGAAGDLRRRLALRDAGSARAVARRLPRNALVGHDPEESAGLLLAALGPAPDRGAATAAMREDFAAGRIMVCDGWTISVTEARLCALWR